MNMRFSKGKMLARLTKEGRMHMVGPEELALMDKLDGKVGNDYNWESVTNGANLVWIPADDELEEGTYVSRLDCTVA